MKIKRKLLIVCSVLCLLMLISFGYMYFTGNFQLYLGNKYEQGKGVVKDYKQAFKWYKDSAEKGNIWGEYRLGSMYYEGFGAPQNYEEGMKWYKSSAEKGYIFSQLTLANIFYNYNNHTCKIYRGKKIKKPINKSPLDKYRSITTLADLAKLQNDFTPEYEYTIEDYSGDENYKEAVKWYTMAAEQGNPIGQMHLGYIYENGYGVTKDNIYAHVWYNLSSANTIDNDLRDEVNRYRLNIEYNMTKEQIKKAQEIAREWKPKNN